LVKFGLSGLENLASKLNEYNGKLKDWQIIGFFSSGVTGGFTSYMLSTYTSKFLPDKFRKSASGFFTTSIVAPVLSTATTGVLQSYLNYYAYYGNQPGSFQSFFNDYDYGKAAYKLGFYTFSSIWGYRKQSSIWDMLMNPARYFGSTTFP
jgi:MFS family permease